MEIKFKLRTSVIGHRWRLGRKKTKIICRLCDLSNFFFFMILKNIIKNYKFSRSISINIFIANKK